MLSVEDLDKHLQLESVTLKYIHGDKTVYYKWNGSDGRDSDCWATKDGQIFLPADATSISLTEFFHSTIVWSREEQKIRYIRIKQLKDVTSCKTNKLLIEVNGKEALAGEEQGLTLS